MEEGDETDDDLLTWRRHASLVEYVLLMGLLVVVAVSTTLSLGVDLKSRFAALSLAL